VILLVMACMKPRPVVLYPAALPELEVPALASFEAAEDECPAQVAMKPGRALSTSVVRVEDGAAFPACRGQLVPESHLFELFAAEDDAEFWRTVALEGRTARLADRQLAQDYVELQEAENGALRREVRVLRMQVTVGVTTALLLGTAVGLAAAEIRSGRRLEIVTVNPAQPLRIEWR
jgi:hypothetical protein